MPASYIRVVLVCTFVAMWLVTCAFYWTFLIIPAIFVAGIVAPAGRQIIAIGFIGEEMEVSEVRYYATSVGLLKDQQVKGGAV